MLFAARICSFSFKYTRVQRTSWIDMPLGYHGEVWIILLAEEIFQKGHKSLIVTQILLSKFLKADPLNNNYY